jgi:hypothetical protein
LGYLAALGKELFGKREELPPEILRVWPELAQLRFRRGGFPLRIGGWLLGQSTVAAITLGPTIFLARDTTLNPELLLHELKHVHQFAESKTFPLHYIWESLRRGYHMNRFEAEAREYASRQVARATVNKPSEDA